MPAEALSPRERTILYGMVRSPSLNDRLLAEALGAKASTVTAVRARLEERGLGRRIYIPSLPALGAGVLSISHGGVPPESLPALKRALGRGLFPAGECDSFLALAGPSDWLEMGAFKDFSGAQRRGEGLSRALCGIPGGTAGPGARSLFPVERVRFQNFLDFAPLLRRLFRIRGPAPGPPPFPAAPDRRLPPVERLALYGLVKWPGAADGEIAGNLGISRQAVARSRRLLAGEGRLRPVVIPDPGKLGLGLLAFFHFRFASRLGQVVRGGAVESVLGRLPHVFAVSAGAECLALGAYRDLAAFERGTAGLLPPSDPPGLFDRAPKVRLFPLDGSVFVRDLDFTPFVRAALGLDIAD